MKKIIACVTVNLDPNDFRKPQPDNAANATRDITKRIPRDVVTDETRADQAARIKRHVYTVADGMTNNWRRIVRNRIQICCGYGSDARTGAVY